MREHAVEIDGARARRLAVDVRRVELRRAAVIIVQVHRQRETSRMTPDIRAAHVRERVRLRAARRLMLQDHVHLLRLRIRLVEPDAVRLLDERERVRNPLRVERLDDGILRRIRAVRLAVEEIAPVELDARVLIDLVDLLVDLALDRCAVGVAVVVVCCIERLLLDRAQDIDGRLHRALRCPHEAARVLRVRLRLIEAADLHAHALGDRVRRRVVTGTADFPATCDFLQIFHQLRRIFIERMERLCRRHIVHDDHCHIKITPVSIAKNDSFLYLSTARFRILRNH